MERSTRLTSDFDSPSRLPISAWLEPTAIRASRSSRPSRWRSQVAWSVASWSWLVRFTAISRIVQGDAYRVVIGQQLGVGPDCRWCGAPNIAIPMPCLHRNSCVRLVRSDASQTFAWGRPAPRFEGVSRTLKDADIDALTADGAQDTTRWADAIGAVAEAIRHLESAQLKAALVGEPEAGAARARWNFLVRTAAD